MQGAGVESLLGFWAGGAGVGWKRLWFHAWLFSRWNCSDCGALLKFDWQQRVAIGVASGVVFVTMRHLAPEIRWWAIPLCIVLLVLIFSFDSVCLAEEKKTGFSAPEEKGV